MIESHDNQVDKKQKSSLSLSAIGIINFWNNEFKIDYMINLREKKKTKFHSFCISI